MQQARHLVDEGTRAASARAVHALLDAVVKVDDLRVLAAQLDDDVGLGLEGLDCRLGGDDLLHELKAQPLRQEQAARTGDGDLETSVAEDLARSAEKRLHGGAHVGMMALVAGIDKLCVLVEHGKLHRGGAHVDAQAQLAARPVKARTRRDLDGSLRLGKRRSLRSLACGLSRRSHLSVNLTLGRAVASTSPGKRRLEVTLDGFALVFVGHGRLSPYAVQKTTPHGKQRVSIEFRTVKYLTRARRFIQAPRRPLKQNRGSSKEERLPEERRRPYTCWSSYRRLRGTGAEVLRTTPHPSSSLRRQATGHLLSRMSSLLAKDTKRPRAPSTRGL